jgi:NADH-quinone oxidoreductase subunit L
MKDQALTISPLLWETLAILLLPMLSFLILYIIKWKGKLAGSIYSVLLGCTAILSIHVLLSSYHSEPIHWSVNWFSLSENMNFTAGILLNQETAIMLVIVSVISLIVGLYSIYYMLDDADNNKYFRHLGLFVFSMIGIVISSNLLIMFTFWELVGLSSYLLINHWYVRREANMAATKAFLVNRVGDAAFLIAIAIAWGQFETLELPELYTGMKESAILSDEWISSNNRLPSFFLPLFGFCLFLGASGKSAQFPFQAWLPDAMAGPTPVSALIHAATMVAAGVFLIARVFPLLAIDIMTFMAIAGGITAFMGAVAAMTQYDIKKVLAYSTISQLGYMVMGMGVGAYSASLFHLFTHAFFKAGLFLAAGSVIYGMHVLSEKTAGHFDPQDMRKMGGLKKHMPLTFWCFLILSLALAGIPFFSGFLSKEAIMSGSFAWAEARSNGAFSFYYLIPYAAMVTVALTAYYMARQIYLVFISESRFQVSGKIQFEPPWMMRVMVLILSLMSLGLIWSFNPFSLYDSWFFTHLEVPSVVVPGFPQDLQPVLIDLSRKNHLMISLVSSAMIIAGFLLAWYRYHKSVKFGQIKLGWFVRLSFNNWWLDVVYSRAIVMPVVAVAGFASKVDRKIIDGFIDNSAIVGVVFAKVAGWFDRAVVDGIVHLMASISKFGGDFFRAVQGGNIQRYVAAAVIFMVILFWLII